MSLSQKFSNWKIRNPGKIPDWSKRAAFQLLRATQSMRCLPDYCIIGAQKSGTTSLYSYLALHPQVKPSYVKEIHYYNKHFSKGIEWYRAHFPIDWYGRSAKGFITGEASTMYMYDADCPTRMYADVPDIRLLLVLRDPGDRAVSHFHHRVRTGRESRSIDEAFGSALCRAKAGDYESGTETDYLLYGCYSRFLKHWQSVYPGNQFLVMQAESFFQDPAPLFERVSAFLGIDYLPPESQRKFNSGGYKKAPIAFYEELAAFFEPYNQELYSMPLIDFQWALEP